MSNLYAARMRHSGDPVVKHVPERQQFVLKLGDQQVGLIDYRMDGQVMDILHTEVDAKLGGQGLGSHLAKGALDHARAQGMSVRPTCSFIELYLRRHEEYADLQA